MQGASDSGADPGAGQVPEPAADPVAAPALLRPLLPPGDPVTAAEVVERMGLWQRDPGAGAPTAPATRPYVLLNMVASVDGLATLAGRSRGLSSPADRELFHALRLASDAVMVGAGTVRAERYGRIVRDPAARALRTERGLSAEPLACIVSGRLQLDPTIPLLAEPEARVALLTPAAGELDAGAQLHYVRCERGGELDLTAALAELHGRFGVRVLLCEGGPHLGANLLAHGLLDELLLCVSPLLVGGDPADGPALRILAGAALEPAPRMQLRSVLAADAHLFLRYTVVAPERVSRETMSSSSEAR